MVEREEEIPPFDYVARFLEQRINEICRRANEGRGVDEDTPIYPIIFITQHPVFRYNAAITRPYKGTRQEGKKPWHFDNITQHLLFEWRAVVAHEGLEADDMLAMYTDEHSIICSRDKDLRQVPGWFFSWELGAAPAFGPYYIKNPGYLTYNKAKNKLFGVGDMWFWAQMIMGDSTDNIPGLPKYGPSKAFAMLDTAIPDKMRDIVYKEYQQCYGEMADAVFNEHYDLLHLVRNEEEWKHTTARHSPSPSRPTPESIEEREKPLAD